MTHQYKMNKADEYYTKEYAVKPILKYITKNQIIWCPFDDENSNYIKLIANNGNKVIFSHIKYGQDFFDYIPQEKFDVIITNPPYSKREDILIRLYEIGKPFAILINEAGLFDSLKRYELFKNNKFEIMVFNKRINYIKNDNFESKTGVPFKSIYLCSNILPSQFIFTDI